ncbi:uncharacterized protein LOC126273246 [Schistocerca gregaria]|uniref:uncharacterized protein LOC126273246 n=1 Tax=Schistocerca gregaria TaxID=7010 RepID=UPI00211E438B|nr:uncharacterized protein LOC126273246 [Schistocerca gregaria]
MGYARAAAAPPRLPREITAASGAHQYVPRECVRESAGIKVAAAAGGATRPRRFAAAAAATSVRGAGTAQSVQSQPLQQSSTTAAMEPRQQWSVVYGGALLLCSICSSGAVGALQPGNKVQPTTRDVLTPASPTSDAELQSSKEGAVRSNDVSATKGAPVVMVSPDDFRPAAEGPSTGDTVRNARLLTAEDIAGKELEYLPVPDSDVFVLQMADIVPQSSVRPVTEPPPTTSDKVREATVAAATMATKIATMATNIATTAKVTTTQAVPVKLLRPEQVELRQPQPQLQPTLPQQLLQVHAMAAAKAATTTQAAPVKLLRLKQVEPRQPQPQLQPMLPHQPLHAQTVAAATVSTTLPPVAPQGPLLIRVREEKQYKPQPRPPQQRLRPQASAVPKVQTDKRSNSKRSPLLEQLKKEAVADEDVVALLPRGFQLPIPTEEDAQEAEGGDNGLAVALGHRAELPASEYAQVGQDGGGEYQFSYSVRDEERGTFFGQSESRSSGRTTGRYWQRLPDGRHQAVSYWADDVTGYRAHVKYSDQPEDQ